MGEDGARDVGVGDRGEDLHRAGAAGTDPEVVAKDAAEQVGPRQPARGQRASTRPALDLGTVAIDRSGQITVDNPFDSDHPIVIPLHL
ncbi:MAG TPA: hypothetical protein VHE35_24085 [Kofleriaceae bacterium]|nr:hypothetical protein [Kofleriaceae bacterium]